MNENQEVALSYEVVGAQLLRGEYRYDKNAQRLVTIKEPVDDVCTVRTTLNNEFCEYHSSVEARPNKGLHVHTKWMVMTPTQRLAWHVVRFAYDNGNVGRIKYNIQ